SVGALVGLDVLELSALVADGIELGARSASHCGATRGHGSSGLSRGVGAGSRQAPALFHDAARTISIACCNRQQQGASQQGAQQPQEAAAPREQKAQKQVQEKAEQKGGDRGNEGAPGSIRLLRAPRTMGELDRR